MPSPRTPRPARVFALSAALLLGLMARAEAGAAADPAERLLGLLHPDYRAYVGSVRPLPEGAGTRAAVYMALVRPGATDATSRGSAPYAGRGALNDIVYDPAVLGAGRSRGWVRLLLDHEYFHARHLAGTTPVPLPEGLGAQAAQHYYEAVAWGYSVAQARAGDYPGLRESEFREALDRYGDHSRALRRLTGYGAPEAGLTATPAPSSGAPAPPSARGR